MPFTDAFSIANPFSVNPQYSNTPTGPAGQGSADKGSNSRKGSSAECTLTGGLRWCRILISGKGKPTNGSLVWKKHNSRNAYAKLCASSSICYANPSHAELLAVASVCHASSCPSYAVNKPLPCTTLSRTISSPGSPTTAKNVS